MKNISRLSIESSTRIELTALIVYREGSFRFLLLEDVSVTDDPRDLIR